LWLALGGFQEKGPDDKHIYNTHVLLDDNGRICTSYRKIHLFDVDVPGGPVLKESNNTAPGMIHSCTCCFCHFNDNDESFLHKKKKL
jgi:predicted amidohydrolase